LEASDSFATTVLEAPTICYSERECTEKRSSAWAYKGKLHSGEEDQAESEISKEDVEEEPFLGCEAPAEVAKLLCLNS
jgi:hypothetical protein